LESGPHDGSHGILCQALPCPRFAFGPVVRCWGCRHGILVHKTASLQRVKDVERVKVGITLQNAGSRLVVRIFHVLEVNNLCSFHMCFCSCFGLFPTCCVMCTNVYYTTGGFGENSTVSMQYDVVIQMLFV
jgi:hypothetical protein